jgi:hypothetical protein
MATAIPMRNRLGIGIIQRDVTNSPTLVDRIILPRQPAADGELY